MDINKGVDYVFFEYCRLYDIKRRIWEEVKKKYYNVKLRSKYEFILIKKSRICMNMDL